MKLKNIGIKIKIKLRRTRQKQIIFTKIKSFNFLVNRGFIIMLL